MVGTLRWGGGILPQRGTHVSAIKGQGKGGAGLSNYLVNLAFILMIGSPIRKTLGLNSKFFTGTFSRAHLHVSRCLSGLFEPDTRMISCTQCAQLPASGHVPFLPRRRCPGCGLCARVSCSRLASLASSQVFTSQCNEGAIAHLTLKTMGPPGNTFCKPSGVCSNRRCVNCLRTRSYDVATAESPVTPFLGASSLAADDNLLGTF